MANLKNFTKGDSRINRKGAPKKLPQLDVLLAEILGDEKAGITAAKAILAKLRSKALEGDTRSAELLFDRAYGKAKQDLGLGGLFGEGNIQLMVNIVRNKTENTTDGLAESHSHKELNNDE